MSLLRRHWPLWASLVVVLAGRILLYDWPISPDESGFYLVADDLLHHGGHDIYGHYWVDRPPMLVWIFMVAATWGKVEAIRWVVGVFFLAFVALSYVATRLMGGGTGVTVAVAAALAVTPAVGSTVGNGEAFAIPFVMASIVMTLLAEKHTGRRALWYAGLAGLLGLAAMTVKQNFVEGLAFGLVLLVAAGLRKERAWSDVVRRLGAGLVGVLVGCAGLAAWASTRGSGVAGLWEATVSFRLDATDVIRDGPRGSIDVRLDALVSNAWLSGIVALLAALLLVVLASRLRGGATAWAVGGVVVVEVVGVVVGGQFWTHYLLGLAPGLVLAAGLVTGWHRTVVFLVLIQVVASAALLAPTKAHEAAGWGTARQVAIGEFVAESAEPGDTATTLFGRADFQLQTGLRSPYRHLWSLPVRVLDPDLAELAGVLRSDDAPTWLVQVFPLDSWGLDPAGTVAELVEERYDRVLDACGVHVYLLRSEHRDLALVPTC